MPAPLTRRHSVPSLATDIVLNIAVAAFLENFDLDEDEKIRKQYKEYVNRQQAIEKKQQNKRYDGAKQRGVQGLRGRLTRAGLACTSHSSVAVQFIRRIVGDQDEQRIKIPNLPERITANVKRSEIEYIMPNESQALLQETDAADPLLVRARVHIQETHARDAWACTRRMDMRETHGLARDAWACKRCMGLHETHGHARDAWACTRRMGMHETHGHARDAWERRMLETYPVPLIPCWIPCP